MSKRLETLVDEFLAAHKDKLAFSPEDPLYEMSYKAVRKKLIEDVTNEINAEQVDIVTRWAEAEMQQKREERQIKELRKLICEGFIVAFFVGLLVNQATDLISVFKGVMERTVLNKTLFIAVILLLVYITIFVVDYLAKLVDYLKALKEK